MERKGRRSKIIAGGNFNARRGGDGGRMGRTKRWDWEEFLRQSSKWRGKEIIENIRGFVVVYLKRVYRGR